MKITEQAHAGRSSEVAEYTGTFKPNGAQKNSAWGSSVFWDGGLVLDSRCAFFTLPVCLGDRDG